MDGLLGEMYRWAYQGTVGCHVYGRNSKDYNGDGKTDYKDVNTAAQMGFKAVTVAPEPVTAEPEQEKQSDVGNELDYEISLLELTLEIVDDLKPFTKSKRAWIAPLNTGNHMSKLSTKTTKWLLDAEKQYVEGIPSVTDENRLRLMQIGQMPSGKN